MRSYLTVAFSFACALAPSCDCGLEPLSANPGSIAGVLCDTDSGAPQGDATVEIVAGDEHLTVSTEEDGSYYVDRVPAGPVRVLLPGERFVDVTIASGQTTQLSDTACRNEPVVEIGSLRGRVCNGHVGNVVAGADVLILLPDESRLSAVTDTNGEFRFDEVPVGTHALSIRGTGFSRSQAVTVENGVETVIDVGDECAIPEPIPEPLRGRIAVVRGSQFDHVEQVLGSLGVDEENITLFDGTWATELLGPDEAIRDYDVVFLNCRSAETAYLASSVMRDRMRSYIEAGGSVFASDQAYDLIEVTFPTKIEFLNDDGTPGAADKGAIGDVSASIINNNMATLFGRSTATLHFPLETWSIMTSVGAGVDVYLTGDANIMRNGGRVDDAPMIVGFSHGEGRVTYSSFHQEPGSHPDQLRILQLLMFEL